MDRKNDRKVTKFYNFICWVFKSPVSQVFHTVVTVRIHLKTQLEWEHPFHRVSVLAGQSAQLSSFHIVVKDNYIW